MEVILLERVGRLGTVGDIVTVKDGYARNYLIPQQKVLRANAANKALFQERKEQIEAENQQKRDAAGSIAAKADNLIVVLIRQSGEDGRLFGSVNARDIADAIVAAGIEGVKREHIILSNPIKSIGLHPVQVNLHAEVRVKVNINVARTETEAAEAARNFLKKDKKEEVVAEEVAAPEEASAAE